MELIPDPSLLPDPLVLAAAAPLLPVGLATLVPLLVSVPSLFTLFGL